MIAPAAMPMLSAEAHPIEAVAVPKASRVPPELLFHRFQPTAVATAVAVIFEKALRFVALIWGELAEANVTVARPGPAPAVNGPSNGDCEVGEAVASDIHRVVGRVGDAPPVTQSNVAFSISGESGIYQLHPARRSRKMVWPTAVNTLGGAAG